MSSVANPSSSGLERDARRMHEDDKPLSPGSVAIHLPTVDAVFVGDALTTRHVPE